MSGGTSVTQHPGWASVEEIGAQLRRSSEQARAQLLRESRTENLILLLQTLHPQIWKDLNDLLNARDAMLGEDI